MPVGAIKQIKLIEVSDKVAFSLKEDKLMRSIHMRWEAQLTFTSEDIRWLCVSSLKVKTIEVMINEKIFCFAVQQRQFGLQEYQVMEYHLSTRWKVKKNCGTLIR